MEKGVFIALEGGEGVGKTTQRELLKTALPEIFPDREFIFTHEPGGSPLAQIIRSLILTDAREADGTTMFHLFAAARADHLRNTVLPALARGSVVVSDRYIAATWAYQVNAMQPPVSLALFDQYLAETQMADLTVILDMNPNVSQGRVRARSGQEENHFDTRPLDFHERLRDAYASWVEKSGNRAVLVDAVGSVGEVHDRVLAPITKLLAK